MMRPPPEPPGHASRSGAIPLALERTKSAHLALLPLFSCELRRLSDLEKVTHGGTPTGGAPEATEPLDLAPPWLGGGQGHGLWRPDRPYRRAPSSSCPPSSRSPQLARSNSEQIMASPGTAIGRTTQVLDRTRPTRTRQRTSSSSATTDATRASSSALERTRPPAPAGDRRGTRNRVRTTGRSEI